MRLAAPFLALVLVAAWLAAGCDKRPSGTDPAALAAGRDSLTAFLASRNTAFEQGNWDGWANQMADDAYLTAAEPGRALSGRDSIHAAMQADYAPAFQAGLSMQSTLDSQDIWLDDSGQVAAATSALDYIIKIQDQRIPLKLRATTLLGRDSSGWKVLVEHYSRAIAYDTLFLALVNRRVQAPARVGQSVAPEAGELVTQFRKDLKDFTKASFNENAVVVTPSEIVHGAMAAQRALTSWLGPAGNATEANTGMRAALAPGARTGWVATTVYVPIFAGPESSIAPIRVLVLYHIKGDHWEIVQAHFSVGWSQRS